MRRLLTTSAALRELAAGISASAVEASSSLVMHRGEIVDVLLSTKDSVASRRALLDREQFERDPFVPEGLEVRRRQVLSRMASFIERSSGRPLSLPKGWRQFKFNHYIAFYALPGEDVDSTRWIAEIAPVAGVDVVFWRTTRTNDQRQLEDFATEKRVVPDLSRDWNDAIAELEKAAELRRRPVSDVDIDLPSPVVAVSGARSYSEWLEAISADQAAFVNASVDRSIRLRGPAGSGKTLALVLKAVREVLSARERGRELRVLLATHSWSLASQVQDALESMGQGSLREIDAFPLLDIAQALMPTAYQLDGGFSLIGEDSYSGKIAQLDEIREVLEEFVRTDWVTYKSSVSGTLRSRIDSGTEDDRKALAWDLLLEFGSVIGPSAIFPGAGSELRYMQLPRSPWMMPLDTREDLRVIYRLYCDYMESLEVRRFVTSDQVLADFLSYLETHAWNRARRDEGYDLVLVDEFHMFNPLERHVLHYLTRDVSSYPRVFMAVDPRQSPSEAFIGSAADETLSRGSVAGDDTLGDVDNFELSTVHRFTPEILALVKHVHHEFPTLELGREWLVDLSRAESSRMSGSTPLLVACGSRSSEETEVYKAVQEAYSRGRIAIAVVGGREWARYSELAARILASRKYHVTTVSSRGDVAGVGYRQRGVVVGPAEYLAGLQFDTVLVAGMPDINSASVSSNEKARLLSLIYLAISRAERDVRIFVNDDDGGEPAVMQRAVQKALLERRQGALV